MTKPTFDLSSYYDAVSFSYLMHKGQVRRDLNIPYWVHVSMVSATVAEWGGDEVQVMAALTHDVVEDTGITAEGLCAVMGNEVAQVVDGLSGSKDKAVSWRYRKLMYITAFDIEAVDPRCYLVKLADSHGNIISFTNTMIRDGVCTAKADTINSYVALTHICLQKLQMYGTPQQYRVARFNMERIFDRLKSIGLCDAELLNEINFDDSSVNWYTRLSDLWAADN